jgi:hypothetical protein
VGHRAARKIAERTGPAVVQVDHVTKDPESRVRFAIGGQAKMNGLTGSAYTIEVAQPVVRGLRGVVVMRVAKDRLGYIRGQSGPLRKTDRTQESARVTIDSTGPNTVVTVEPWHGADGMEAATATFRPTHAPEREEAALKGHDRDNFLEAVYAKHIEPWVQDSADVLSEILIDAEVALAEPRY